MTQGLTRRTPAMIEGWGVSMQEIVGGKPGSVDPRTLFDSPDHPLEIEIGSGKGTFLVQQGATQSDTNFLGIEWSAPFFRFAADRLRRHGLGNARMLHGDGSEFLGHWCLDGVATVLHLYFLDPWPKARHHKRRVIQDSSIRNFHRVLTPGGRMHLVTDHDGLWEWYLQHFDRCSDLFEVIEFRPPASAGEGEVVGTNFERKYRREGRPFNAATLVRR